MKKRILLLVVLTLICSCRYYKVYINQGGKPGNETCNNSVNIYTNLEGLEIDKPIEVSTDANVDTSLIPK